MPTNLRSCHSVFYAGRRGLKGGSSLKHILNARLAQMPEDEE
jgi:hypothetical protein